MAARPPPPAIMDDLIIEILLRLPPEDSTFLVRASLVCKSWRRLLSDHTLFLRRYREIHGAAPIMGFLYTRETGPRFLCTSQPSPFPLPASVSTCSNLVYYRTILDCRHGRVLLHHTEKFPPSFTVWEPITGRQKCFSGPEYPLMAAVLCASDACDHLDCSGRPFRVVLVSNNLMAMVGGMAQASIYSSETGKWSVCASTDSHCVEESNRPSLFVGDALFFLTTTVFGSTQILKYDLTRGVLSAICMPPPTHRVKNMMLCNAEDGGLGVAVLEGCSLRLLSGRTEPDGVMSWAQDKALELDSVIPIGVGDASTKFYVIGFAEGTGYIFVSVNDSIYSVDLKSSMINKIGSGKFGIIFPFMRFLHYRSC